MSGENLPPLLEKKTCFSPLFFKYLARRFFFSFLGFFFGLTGLVYLITLVEVGANLGRTAASFATIALIALYRTPELAEEIMPFVVLFSGMATLWRFNRSHELIIIRASGSSIWSILLPLLVVASAIGCLSFAVLNPLSSALYGKGREMTSSLKKGKTRSFNLLETGLWLRQGDADNGGHHIVHAKRAKVGNKTLQGVMILELNDRGVFTKRYDSKTASLEDGYWQLNDVWVSIPGKKTLFQKHLQIPTDLTIKEIQKSSVTSKSISFWQLPHHIQLLERAGLPTDEHKLRFHRQASKPLLFLTMILLAAPFSIRSDRRGGVGIVIFCGILTGFLMFFLSSFVFALGQLGNIPAFAAAWTPTVVAAALGTAAILHLEDG